MNSIADIPVLYFPFSRPQYARKTFEAIKKAKPKKFYFYCDKAREAFEEEKKNNDVIREYIKEVNWDCELKTWFRDKNIGAYQSILDAIDWFFENEEMGIILEEDCLASLAFFDFCRQLLSMYKDDYRVWYIGGNNLIEKYYLGKYDYYFTPFAYQWGWATWRSRWMKIQRNGFDISEIKNYGLYNQLYANKKAAKKACNWLTRQTKTTIFKTLSWDYMFNISMRCNGGFGICPKINLSANIGIVGLNNAEYNKRYHNLYIPLDQQYYSIVNHPPFVVSDYNYNKAFFKHILLKKESSLITKIIKKIRTFVKINKNNNK